MTTSYQSPCSSANTYAGKRNDLRNGDEDSIDIPDIDQIKLWAIQTCRKEMGITAYMLSDIAGVTKEWARKILNRMYAAGDLRCDTHGQMKLFHLPDIPCPHCGEMMSAYMRSGTCNRCFEFGGGR